MMFGWSFAGMFIETYAQNDLVLLIRCFIGPFDPIGVQSDHH